MKNQSLIERFMQRAEIDFNGCWLWAGNGDRYGQVWLNGENVSTHRLSYELFHGPIRKGNSVCHKCDVPKCWRPSHLFQGTQKQNIQDAINKKRQTFSTVPPIHIGEAAHFSKLTERQVKEIRQRYHDNPSLRGSDLAKEFGIKKSSMCALLRGKSWKHLL